MISMTGFGSVQERWKSCEIYVEVKCYNNRFLDLRVNLPPFFSNMEAELRKLAASRFIRGRVEINVSLKSPPETRKKVVLNRELALEWKKALEEMSALLSIPIEDPGRVLSKCNGLFTLVSEEEVFPDSSVLKEIFIRVIDGAAKQREDEGLNLGKDIQVQITTIASTLENVEKHLPEHTRKLNENFLKRLTDMLQAPFVADITDGLPNLEARVVLEAAGRIIKNDINEEIVRMKSHLKAFRTESANEGPHGKKLDFIAQEIGREINTMSAKIYSPDLAQAAIIMRDSLEKIREQLRNIQ